MISFVTWRLLTIIVLIVDFNFRGSSDGYFPTLMFAARKVSRSHRRKRSTEDEVDVEDSSTGESLSLDDLK